MIVDHIGNWAAYNTSAPWKFAFDYLHSLTPEAETTEMTPLMGDDVLARVMCYETRSVDDAVLEAHDAYVDIQMTLAGGEGIEWFPRSTLTVKTPYDAAADVVFFYRPDIAPVRIQNVPGMFSVFFPDDAHSPQLTLGDAPALIKKVVVKLLAAAITR